jgi:hypothetical protein
MANPTALSTNFREDHDNLALMCDQIIVNSKVVVSSQQALVADASVAHALNATFSDTEAEAALNALGTKINAILDILEAHGLMADA